MAQTAAHFQGDERDVVFLSLVDAPSEKSGPLRMVQTDTMKQRFNVAASRARNQMWVVHSLRPEVDLKVGDLRRQLIEYATHYRTWQAEVQRLTPRTDSVFEVRVLRQLVEQGYRVHPQWPVGAYRIDLVVEGTRGRVAIECDGEKFHGPDQLQADLERQEVLERLGWRFIRIRGSQYFRDPGGTMRRVVQRLQDLDIDPAGQATGFNAPGDDEAELLRQLLSEAATLRESWRQAGEEVSPAPSPPELPTPTPQPSSAPAPVPQSPPPSRSPPSPTSSSAQRTAPARSESRQNVIDFSPRARPPMSTVPSRTPAGPVAAPQRRELEELLEAAPDGTYNLLCALDEIPRGKKDLLGRAGIRPDQWSVCIRFLVSNGIAIKQGERRGTRYVYAPDGSPLPPRQPSTGSKSPTPPVPKRAHLPQALLATTPARVRNDPVLKALLQIAPDLATVRCPRCTQATQLFIGKKGPFYKCDNSEGRHSTPVVAEHLPPLIQALQLTCASCNTVYESAQSYYGNYLRCPNPQCSNKENWRDARNRLRLREQS